MLIPAFSYGRSCGDVKTEPNNMALTDPFVTSEWLVENLTNPDLVVLNATLPKADSTELPAIQKAIPGTRFFDLENTFRDTNDPRPNTMPSPEKFTREARKLGINHRSIIIVYDEHGIYSSS